MTSGTLKSFTYLDESYRPKVKSKPLTDKNVQLSPGLNKKSVRTAKSFSGSSTVCCRIKG
jgi:hypothetical protein